jgi:hypothetical protein
MKLSSSLLQAITLGIAVGTLSSSCQKNEVNSGTAKHENIKKDKKNKSVRDNCPSCGMG